MDRPEQYDIERKDHGRWHSDIGEAFAWPSIEAALAAVDTLRGLGEEWLGEYRVVERGSGQIVAEYTLDGDGDGALQGRAL